VEKEKKFKKKGTESDRPAVDPWSPAGCGSTPGLSGPGPIFEISYFIIIILLLLFYYCYFIIIILWKFGRISVQHPHFLKFAPTLGSVECFILHGNRRFHFFSNFIFPKFRVHLDLHIYHWDFYFMKN
jgi:hypothetical protein